MGRTAATGRGVMVAAGEAIKAMGIKPEEATCAVQGFGNVGSWTAKLIHDLGVKIVALSDVYGAIMNEDGLDPYEVEKHVQATGSVVTSRAAKLSATRPSGNGGYRACSVRNGTSDYQRQCG